MRAFLLILESEGQVGLHFKKPATLGQIFVVDFGTQNYWWWWFSRPRGRGIGLGNPWKWRTCPNKNLKDLTLPNQTWRFQFLRKTRWISTRICITRHQKCPYFVAGRISYWAMISLPGIRYKRAFKTFRARLFKR